MKRTALQLIRIEEEIWDYMDAGGVRAVSEPDTAISGLLPF